MTDTIKSQKLYKKVLIIYAKFLIHNLPTPP